VVAAEKPASPIEKGLPGPGLLAQVAVSKYGDHLPLNRMESIFQRHGVELSQKTMCDWMAACAELVSPVWERMREVVLTSKAVQTDDTPVPVLDRELTRTRTGRIWTYVGDRHGPYIVYDYTSNRSREGPEEFLRGYCGYLQADAYAGYDAMFKNPKRYLTEVACWAHYPESSIIQSELRLVQTGRKGIALYGARTPDKVSETIEECEQLWRWPPSFRSPRGEPCSLPKNFKNLTLHLQVGCDIAARSGY
jgi:hypothetical protein